VNENTILISGAGIGGATLAFWLNAAGFQPTVIERASVLRTSGYVIDFWGLGYDIAERMGLASDIDRIGYHMREIRIVDDRGERVTGFGTKVFAELTGGRFVTLGRSDLSRLLFEKIKGTTEVIFGDGIVSLQEHADCVQVQFKHAGERKFDLVIGADGLHSNVRRLVFGSEDRFEKHLGYMVAAFEVHGYRPRDEDIYVIYSEPGRMLGRFAMHDDRTLFLFVFATDIVPAALGLSAQKAMLGERFGGGKWECPSILGELDHAGDLYFDRVSQIKMECWSRGRVALTGDAAFCVSLMAGQGAALAMTAAYVLAGELAKAAGRHEEAFGKYEALLRAYIASKQRGAKRFATAFAPRTRLGLLLRNQVIKACAIPGLARLAFGGDIIDTRTLHRPANLPWVAEILCERQHPDRRRRRNCCRDCAAG
jgi:2-polyprenyl-6-methoxyphenol hydroxylase-like FAD-dependent oxidoreductase